MPPATLRRLAAAAPSAPVREPDPWGVVAAAILGAALSLLATGYSFGHGNNFFHLPILARLYDEPQFQADAFMQSLRYYSAGPFLLLEGWADFISPAALFAILLALSRFLTFVGLLLCARLLGVETRRTRLAFVVIVSFEQVLRGSSYAGDGGLFIETFTHSEIANGLLLISIYFGASGRFAKAFVLNGLVFFVNAFMAVWNAVPLGMLMLLALLTKRVTPVQLLRRCALGLIGFAICAAPVVRNVLANPEFGRPIGFDYRAFLVEYWPYHFIFRSSSLGGRLGLLIVVLLGAMALAACGRRARPLGAAFLGFVAVYCAGIVAPMLTGSPLVLNLHLLRSSAAIQLLAGLAAGALATTWLFEKDGRRATVVAPALVLSLCTVRFAMAAGPFIIAAGYLPRLLAWVPPAVAARRRAVVWGTAALLALVWVYGITTTARALAADAASTRMWRELGEWARQTTPPGTVFMVPTYRYTEPSAADSIEKGNEIFEFVSHRRVWIDIRSGAATMWSPSYYALWHDRGTRQLALTSLAERLDFARRNAISFVIDQCRAGEAPEPVFQSGRACVYPGAAAPPGPQ